MGNSRYDKAISEAYSRATTKRSVSDYTSDMGRFVSSGAQQKYAAKEIKVRESKSSVLNPNPTPVIVGLDVSGSMGRIVEEMRRGLDTLFRRIIERVPVSDPHVLAMAIGDMDCDKAPVQATQFEADPVTVGKQIEELYLEGGGGGNKYESYLAPLYFALNKTDCDAFKSKSKKRKGFIFTVGDEEPQLVLRSESLYEFFGDKVQFDIKAEDIVEDVSKNWHYFHLIAMEGSYAARRPQQTVELWTKLLGQQNAIKLTDHKKMAEVITSLIEVTVGRYQEDVITSWDKDTAEVIAEAVKNVAPVIDLT